MKPVMPIVIMQNVIMLSVVPPLVIIRVSFTGAYTQNLSIKVLITIRYKFIRMFFRFYEKIFKIILLKNVV